MSNSVFGTKPKKQLTHFVGQCLGQCPTYTLCGTVSRFQKILSHSHPLTVSLSHLLTSSPSHPLTHRQSTIIACRPIFEIHPTLTIRCSLFAVRLITFSPHHLLTSSPLHLLTSSLNILYLCFIIQSKCMSCCNYL